MNNKELKEIMGFAWGVCATKENAFQMILWHEVLSEFEAVDVKQAVLKYFSESEKPFLPMPAKIKNIIIERNDGFYFDSKSKENEKKEKEIEDSFFDEHGKSIDEARKQFIIDHGNKGIVFINYEFRRLGYGEFTKEELEGMGVID